MAHADRARPRGTGGRPREAGRRNLRLPTRARLARGRESGAKEHRVRHRSRFDVEGAQLLACQIRARPSDQRCSRWSSRLRRSGRRVRARRHPRQPVSFDVHGALRARRDTMDRRPRPSRPTDERRVTTMGLDTTHDCGHGAYSAFMRWRQQLARIVGVPLMLMEGFYEADGDHVGGSLFKQAMEWAAPGDGGPRCGSYLGPVLHRRVEDLTTWLPIRWESLRPDPLNVLLMHSDCDG